MSYNLGTAEGTIVLNYNGKGADKAKQRGDADDDFEDDQAAFEAR